LAAADTETTVDREALQTGHGGRMRFIDSWLTGLGLEYIIPKLKANGITTPKKLAMLSLRDMYEVVGVEDAEDRKKLYFLIQRLQAVRVVRDCVRACVCVCTPCLCW